MSTLPQPWAPAMEATVYRLDLTVVPKTDAAIGGLSHASKKSSLYFLAAVARKLVAYLVAATRRRSGCVRKQVIVETTFYCNNDRGIRADSGCFECTRISDDKVCCPLMPQGAEVRFAFPNRQSRIRLCTLIAILG
jgi:hypothetical protein